MREYIRHPADIPIEIGIGEFGTPSVERMHDVSLGGLCFECDRRAPVGAVLQMRIPSVRPPYAAQVRVAWCRRAEGHYEIGIELLSRDDAFRTRMVEQVLHIEKYRRQVLRTQGRRLSGEEAAAEWIEKFAANFPQWTDE